MYFLVFKSFFFKKKLYHRQYSLTHIVLLRILQKFPPKLLYFFVFKRLLKMCVCNITVWLILPISGSYKNLHQKLVFFLVFKNLFKKNYIRDNMVWSILSFQGSYINVHLTLIHFLILKTYWKIVSGTLRFDLYFPFQGFYQVFI